MEYSVYGSPSSKDQQYRSQITWSVLSMSAWYANRIMASQKLICSDKLKEMQVFFG
jgi:hypothetical protein